MYNRGRAVCHRHFVSWNFNDTMKRIDNRYLNNGYVFHEFGYISYNNGFMDFVAVEGS